MPVVIRLAPMGTEKFTDYLMLLTQNKRKFNQIFTKFKIMKERSKTSAADYSVIVCSPDTSKKFTQADADFVKKYSEEIGQFFIENTVVDVEAEGDHVAVAATAGNEPPQPPPEF